MHVDEWMDGEQLYGWMDSTQLLQLTAITPQKQFCWYWDYASTVANVSGVRNDDILKFLE